MVYAKRILIVCFIASLAGCSTLGNKDKTLQEGYRLGVKENISGFAEHFYGNDFPYFYWVSPIVQNVRIPAHIENGLFVPEHNEPVMIKPGEWRSKFAYPITSSNDKKEVNHTEGGESYALKYFDFDLNRDITVLPESYSGVKPAAKEKDTP